MAIFSNLNSITISKLDTGKLGWETCSRHQCDMVGVVATGTSE